MIMVSGVEKQEFEEVLPSYKICCLGTCYYMMWVLTECDLHMDRTFQFDLN